MQIATSWAWWLAALVVIAACLRAIVLGEQRLARIWPYFHAGWGGHWRVRHALAAAMAAAGMALVCHAHGWSGGFGAFLVSIVWALVAAMLVYLAQWIYIAALVCILPLLLPDVLSGLRHAWRHRRDPVPPALDWLPPGGAKLGAPASPEREP